MFLTQNQYLHITNKFNNYFDQKINNLESDNKFLQIKINVDKAMHKQFGKLYEESKLINENNEQIQKDNNDTIKNLKIYQQKLHLLIQNYQDSHTKKEEEMKLIKLQQIEKQRLEDAKLYNQFLNFLRNKKHQFREILEKKIFKNEHEKISPLEHLKKNTK